MAFTPQAIQSCPNHADVVSGLVRCARCGVAFCADCVVELDGRPYDAACKEEQIRDLKSGTVGADIAGAVRRFGGVFIDGLLFVPLWGFMAVKYTVPGMGMFDNFVPRLLLPGLAYVAYEALMLRFSGGQTLGKKAVRIKVTNADGSDLSGGQAWARAGSRQLMSFTYILGLVDALMVFTANRRTLHDRIGKTIVVNAGP
jgi:uncharacterized RDD family membrane protein YckC